MGNRLYVGNLSFETGAAALEGSFARFGEVLQIRIVTDRETGRSRGFGFVTMIDERSAKQAMSQLDGSELDGRRLKVNEAEDPQQRAGGGTSRSSFGSNRGRTW